jgi:phosphatidylglycerophosphate synthase
MVVFAAISCYKLAFAMFILAALTDYFDGMIARKLGVAKLSADCLMESVADAIYGACAVAGAFLAGWVSLAMGLWVFGLWFPFVVIFLTNKEGTMARRVSDTFCPLYYIGVMVVLAWLYTAKAFDLPFGTVALCSLPLLGIMICQKWHRINNWLHGQP